MSERLLAQLPSLGDLDREPPTERPVLPPRRRQVRLKPEQVVQLLADYQAGESTTSVATRWGVSAYTVREHLKRAGIPLRVRQAMTHEQQTEAERLYQLGWSLQRLAERYGCDDETVRQRLRAKGVPLPHPWERSD